MKSDETLWQEVEQSLRWERTIDAGQIGVHVHNGVVTLTGTVPNLRQKQVIEKVLERVTGYRGLVMELSVPPVSAFVDLDESLATRIIGALSRVPGLPVERVRVEIERGCVTLTGAVDTEAQRREAASVVGNMEGVVGVSNRLTICDPPAADVIVQITRTLGRRLKQEIDNISVETCDGIVTLSGTVGSLDEKRAACLAASQVKGVREVIDRLGIA
ncbi:BON domain-containing protein [Paraburkholderia terrae]|uniref:BON domain-containing protein n=1 Tax=Paraburkholderia terrae TaxID=311230 RepID=UPI0020561842|nr:BON domain-containing protein [Paraburkholderia terrae]BDC45753.1 phospholipid-binding protein [Paraburkholderia terrae]